MFFLLLLSLCHIGQGDAIRCFECQNVSLPNECQKVIECGTNEECFTEQVATVGGGIVYNTGCRKSYRCPTQGIALIGKRSTSVERGSRAIDITTCIECCTNDTCNEDGCGVKDMPTSVRGLYCYNCDSIDDPKACTNTTACAKDQVCMVSMDSSQPQTRYKSHCESQTVCDAKSKAASNESRCSPLCCTSDFCNDHCITTTTTSTTTTTTTTTSPIQTTIPTTHVTHPVTLPAIHCSTHNGYIYLHNHHTELCIHIILHHTTFQHARDLCRQEGGDLVVLDTHAKSVLLRHKLSETNHVGYWIGARDLHHNNHFMWVNNQSAQTSGSNWGGGQPDNVHNGKKQDCVYMAESDDYKWHDTTCDNRLNYICEHR